MKYISDDGTVFSTEAECLAYENNPYNSLEKFITGHITASYNDDAGFSIIGEYDVLKFIVDNLDEINKIMKTENEPSTAGEWISNIGHSRAWYPNTLKGNTEIEVKFRDCSTETGRADDWEFSWNETNTSPVDIIAYRVI